MRIKRGAQFNSLRKTAAISLSIVVLSGSLPAPTLWASPPSSPPGDRPSASLDPATLQVPESLGHVTETFRPTSQLGTRNPKLVLHIQDVHTQYAAQRSIASLISHLHNHARVSFVALEGGAGAAELEAVLNPLPPSPRVVDFLLQQGLVSGPIAQALNAPEQLQVVGVEDAALYLEHLRAYQECQAHRSAAAPMLASLLAFLRSLEPVLYSPALQTLRARQAAYDNGALPLLPYLEHVAALAAERRIALEAYPALQRLQELTRLERALDRRAVAREHQQLMKRLRTALPPAAQGLLAQTQRAVKAGTLSTTQYYLALPEFAARAGLDLASYAHLGAYLQVLQRSRALAPEALVKELTRLAEAVTASLLDTEPARQLHTLTQLLARYQRLMTAALSRDEWDVYQQHRDQSTAAYVQRALAAIAKTQVTRRMPPVTHAELEALFSARPAYERFYQLALQRDEALVANTLKQMEARRQSVAVMVAGGFHTPGITRRLKARGIAYAVITPSIASHAASDAARYHQLLTGRVPSIETLLRAFLAGTARTRSTAQTPRIIPAHQGLLPPYGAQVADDQDHVFENIHACLQLSVAHLTLAERMARDGLGAVNALTAEAPHISVDEPHGAITVRNADTAITVAYATGREGLRVVSSSVSTTPSGPSRSSVIAAMTSPAARAFVNAFTPRVTPTRTEPIGPGFRRAQAHQAESPLQARAAMEVSGQPAVPHGSTADAAGQERQPVEPPTKPLPDVVRRAEAQLNAYLAPDISGQVVWDEQSEPLSAYNRTQEKGLHGVVRLAPGRQDSRPYLIPERLLPLVRQARLSPQINPDEAIGLLGFHLNAAGRPDLQYPPQAWALIYQHAPGDIRLRVRCGERIVDDPLPSLNFTFYRPDYGAYNPRTIDEVPSFGAFADALIAPRSPEEIRAVAVWLLQQGVKKGNRRPRNALGVRTSRASVSFPLRSVLCLLPSEHVSGGGGTVLTVQRDRATQARWALIAPEGLRDEAALDTNPWIILHDDPRLPAHTVRVLSAEYPEQLLRGETDNKSGLPNVQLARAESFRQLLARLAKPWHARPWRQGRSYAFAVGDLFSFKVRPRMPFVIIRRPGAVNAREGRENKQVLLLAASAACLREPLAPVLSASDRAALHNPDAVLLDGLLHAALPLPPSTLTRLQEAAMVRLQLPAEDPRQVEIVPLGFTTPWVAFKTFQQQRSGKPVPFNLDVPLHVLRLMQRDLRSSGGWAAGSPHCAAWLRSADLSFVDAFSAPAWHMLEVDYRLILWADPAQVPWIIREDEYADFLRARADKELPSDVREEVPLRPPFAVRVQAQLDQPTHLRVDINSLFAAAGTLVWEALDQPTRENLVTLFERAARQHDTDAVQHLKSRFPEISLTAGGGPIFPEGAPQGEHLPPSRCVTGDTVLAIASTTERSGLGVRGSGQKTIGVQIKDVQAGMRVWSLNEATGKLEPRRIKALVPMGIKPVFRLTTASGKTIRTTGNHPYLVLSRSRIGNGAALHEPTRNRINWSAKWVHSAMRVRNELIRAAASLWGIRSQTTAYTSPWPYVQKSSSLVTTMRRSFFDQAARRESGVERGARLTSAGWARSQRASSIRTFSSSRNFRLGVEDDIRFLGQRAGIVQGGADVVGTQGREGRADLLHAVSSRQHLQDLPDHDPRTRERRFAMANLGVRHNIGIDHDALHSAIKYSPAQGLVKKAAWTPVAALQPGMRIAVAEGAADTVRFEPIRSIEAVGREPVYDIEVEGTHNFVANGIVAHNTSLAPPANKEIPLEALRLRAEAFLDRVNRRSNAFRLPNEVSREEWERLRDEYDHVIGLATFSMQLVDDALKEPVAARLKAEVLDRLQRGQRVLVVGGGTNLGGVKDGYDALEDPQLAPYRDSGQLKTMGLIAGMGALAAFRSQGQPGAYGVRDTDYVYVHEEGEGWRDDLGRAGPGGWGVESAVFQDLITELLVFGGGPQVTEEIEGVARRGKSVTVLRGVRNGAGQLGEAELKVLVATGQRRAVEQLQDQLEQALADPFVDPHDRQQLEKRHQVVERALTFVLEDAAQQYLHMVSLNLGPGAADRAEVLMLATQRLQQLEQWLPRVLVETSSERPKLLAAFATWQAENPLVWFKSLRVALARLQRRRPQAAARVLARLAREAPALLVAPPPQAPAGELLQALRLVSAAARNDPAFAVTARALAHDAAARGHPPRSVAAVRGALLRLHQLGLLDRRRAGHAYRYALVPWLQAAIDRASPGMVEIQLNPCSIFYFSELDALRTVRLRGGEQLLRARQAVDRLKIALMEEPGLPPREPPADAEASPRQPVVVPDAGAPALEEIDAAIAGTNRLTMDPRKVVEIGSHRYDVVRSDDDAYFRVGPVILAAPTVSIPSDIQQRLNREPLLLLRGDYLVWYGDYTAVMIAAMLEHDVRDAVMEDDGVGSGVLSLLALKRRARRTVGIDHDLTELLRAKAALEHAGYHGTLLSHTEWQSYQPNAADQFILVQADLAEWFQPEHASARERLLGGTLQLRVANLGPTYPKAQRALLDHVLGEGTPPLAILGGYEDPSLWDSAERLETADWQVTMAELHRYPVTYHALLAVPPAAGGPTAGRDERGPAKRSPPAVGAEHRPAPAIVPPAYDDPEPSSIEQRLRTQRAVRRNP